MTMAPHEHTELPSDWRERLTAVLTQDGVVAAHSPPPQSRRSVFRLMGLALLLTVPPSLFILFGLKEDNFAVAAALESAAVALLMLVGPGAFGRFQRAAAARKHGVNPLTALRDATRPPVLLLRSFNFDAALMKRGLLPTTMEQNFAYFLADRLKTKVLAIGRPGEFEPPPGAARFYVRHDLWEQTVAATVPLCSLVVWTTGRTAGMQWEIEHLRQNISPRRLLLWLHVHIGKWTPERRAVEWTSFLEMFQDVFPNALPQDVRHITCLAFDDEWRPQGIPGPLYPASNSESPGFFGLTAFLKAVDDLG